jgi:hypothetical protein
MIELIKGLKNPFCDGPVINFAAIESIDEFKEALRNANVICAVDTGGTGQTIVYGTELLRAISAEVIPPQQAEFAVFGVDYRTTLVEKLIAAVDAVKGFNEWPSKKAVVNGEQFWNPKEGIECGIKIIQLIRAKLADGELEPAPGSHANPVEGLRRLESGVNAALPKIKLAVQECLLATAGFGARQKPLRLGEVDVQFLRLLKEQIALTRPTIGSKGSFRLADLAIEFAAGEVRFSTKTYFDFIARSVDEVLDAASTDGMLRGPTAGQSGTLALDA